MAFAPGLRNAMDVLQDGLVEVTAEVEAVGLQQAADKEELIDMIKEVKDEIATLGKAVAQMNNLVGWDHDRGGGGYRKVKELLNVKASMPEKFSGKGGDSFRAWSQGLKAYTNSIHPGFRRVLTWAEAAPDVLDSSALELVSWKPLKYANGQLYDLLITLTDGDARNMVLGVKDDNGLEAYRKLTAWYDSYGRTNELDRFNKLLSVTRCRSIGDVPRAVEEWEVKCARVAE